MYTLSRRQLWYLGGVGVLALVSCILTVTLWAQTSIYYLNGIPYIFPASQGTTGTLLTNSGTGVLTWSPAPTPEGLWTGSAILSTVNCPAGWTRNTTDGGRYLVITPTGGTNNGTLGTALADLENRLHTHSGPSHQHTGDVHGHGWAGGTTAPAGDHQHTWGNPFSASGTGSYSGTTGAESAGQMNVDAGSSGNMTRAPHSHNYSGTVDITVNGSVGGTTSTNGDHTHGPGSLNIALGGGGLTGAAGTGQTGANTVYLAPYKQLILCTKN